MDISKIIQARRLAVVTCIILFFTNSTVFAQVTISKNNIPTDIKEFIFSDIEKLYSPEADIRAEAMYCLGQKGKDAVPAIVFIIDLLNDKSELSWRSSNGKIISSKGTVADEAVSALVNLGSVSIDSLISCFNNKNSIVLWWLT